MDIDTKIVLGKRRDDAIVLDLFEDGGRMFVKFYVVEGNKVVQPIVPLDILLAAVDKYYSGFTPEEVIEDVNGGEIKIGPCRQGELCSPWIYVCATLQDNSCRVEVLHRLLNAAVLEFSVLLAEKVCLKSC